MKSQTFKRTLSKIGFWLALGGLLFFALFPLFWILLTSFKSNRDLFAMPPKIFFMPTLEHWNYVIYNSEFLHYYRNSVIIAISTGILVMVIATLAAYSLARGRYKARDNVAYFILSQRMMPAVAVVLPIYMIFSNLRQLDKLTTLIFMNLAFNLPLSIWMIRGFIDSLNIELEEAAVVDGTSWFGAFLRIGVPQILPGLLSTVLLVFIYTINEFFFALILSGTHARPVSVAVQLFLPTGVRGTLFGEAAAASLMIMLPCLLFAFFMQKYLVSGLSLGALKG